MDHHKYGPSALAMYESCPGYIPAESDTAHPVTLSGSRIHDAMETGDLSQLETEEETEVVRLMQEYEKTIIPAGNDWVHRREERVTYEVPGLPEGVDTPFGTFDHLVYRLDRAILIDYKGGYMPVTDAEKNIQIQAYVLGVFQKYPQLQQVAAYVLQPRIDRVTYHRYKRDDCLWITRRIQNVITLSVAADEDNFVPKYNTCRFCARMADCPAVNQIAYKTTRRIQPDIVVPKGTVRGSEVKDGRTMGRLLDVAKVLEGWCENVKYHAQQLYVTEGEEPQGYVAVTRSGRREITNPVSAAEVASSYGIDNEDFLSTCKVSVSELSKRVRETAARGDKKSVEAEFIDRLRANDSYVVGNPTTFFKRNNDNR